MDSCMAHLNYFPSRVADVNFCFFIAVPSGSGCWYYAKCEMVLHKINGKMNMQNCGYQRNEDGGNWCSMTDSNGSCNRLVPSFSKRWHVANVKIIVGDNQATLMVDWNSTNIEHSFQFYVYLRLRDRDWCSAADSNGNCHRLAPSFSEEMTRCQHHKHCWRWPDP